MRMAEGRGRVDSEMDATVDTTVGHIPASLLSFLMWSACFTLLH